MVNEFENRAGSSIGTHIASDDAIGSKVVPKKKMFVNKGGFATDLLKAFLGELCGTFMFLWTAYIIAQAANHDYIAAVSTASTQYPDTLSAAMVLVIALGFGFAVSVAITVFGPISGGNLNPAVTLSLVITRDLNPITAVVMWIAQILAAMAAAGAVDAMTPGKILFANSLGLETSKTRGLFIEAFGTALLCTTVLFTAIKHSHIPVHINSIAIGVSLFMAHLVCIPFTGAGVNPARSFGPCVAGLSFPVYHWIYWVGPFIGAAFSSLLYLGFKALTNVVPIDDEKFHDIDYLRNDV